MRPACERRLGALALAALACFAGAAAADPGLNVAHGWARATPPGVNVGAGYFDIEGGAGADRLLRAHSARARSVEFHESRLEAGIARMRELAAVPVASRARVSFAPGGLHLMLVGLQSPLLAGERVPVTLEFERAGLRELVLEVAGAAASTDAAAAGTPRRIVTLDVEAETNEVLVLQRLVRPDFWLGSVRDPHIGQVQVPAARKNERGARSGSPACLVEALRCTDQHVRRHEGVR